MSRLPRGLPRVVLGDGGGDDRGAERHRILRELEQNLERHPAVGRVTGRPGDQFAELEATVNSIRFGHDVETATFRVTWYPHVDDADFVFHYSDSSGRDFGWHREPNPHVEGKTQYQERRHPDGEYEYSSASFAAVSPVGILWDVLDRLAERLADLPEDD